MGGTYVSPPPAFLDRPWGLRLGWHGRVRLTGSLRPSLWPGAAGTRLAGIAADCSGGMAML